MDVLVTSHCHENFEMQSYLYITQKARKILPSYDVFIRLSSSWAFNWGSWTQKG